MGNFCKHLKVIRTHRKYVKKACFKMSIPWQGLTHDLSKYSPTELSIYKYYTGHCSPHDEARKQLGYSPSWIHHKHVNKHHYQFWLDDSVSGEFIGIKMPYKYVIEMMCDFIGAGKAYNLKSWTTKAPWDYWIRCCKGKRIMHPMSEQLLEELLAKMRDSNTEKEFYDWYHEHKKQLKDSYLRG